MDFLATSGAILGGGGTGEASGHKRTRATPGDFDSRLHEARFFASRLKGGTCERAGGGRAVTHLDASHLQLCALHVLGLVVQLL